MNPLKLLHGVLLTVLLMVFILVHLVFWVPIRFIVLLLAKLFRPNLDGMLETAQVSLFQESLYDHPQFNIVSYIVLDGNLPADKFREKAYERVFHPLINNPRDKSEYDPLRRSITSFCGYYFWKKEQVFDVRNHVYTYEEMLQDKDSGPGEGESLPLKSVYTEDDLKTIADYLTTRNWKRGQGPWEVIILNNFQGEEYPEAKVRKGESTELQTVMMFRLHHVLGDGYSFTRLFAQAFDFKDGLCASPTLPKRGPWAQALYLISLPLKAFWDMAVFFSKRRPETNEWALASRDNELSNSYFCTWSPRIPVDRIKLLKSRFGVSFFAVIQSVMAGVLAKMMKSNGARVPEYLKSVVPVPLPNHPKGLHVHAAGIAVDLLTGEKDPLERLIKTHQSNLGLSKSVVPLVYAQLVRIAGLAPRFVANAITRARGITLGFSPFPGYAKPMQFSPEHVGRKFFFTVGATQRKSAFVCTVGSFTTGENIVFSLTSRRHIIKSRKEIEQFSLFLEQELRALEKASEAMKGKEGGDRSVGTAKG